MPRAEPHHRRFRPEAIRIELPSTMQLEDYTCGPAALLAICAFFGVGPGREPDVARAMRATESGTDPAQIVSAARAFGLRVEEFRGMRDAQLRACLVKRRPVMLMLQAWATPPPRTYAARWSDGHWVVAIGFDDAAVYFEDPSLHDARGFLTWAELDERWHDEEGAERRVERYGVAIWRPGARRSSFARDARHID